MEPKKTTAALKNKIMLEEFAIDRSSWPVCAGGVVSSESGNMLASNDICCVADKIDTENDHSVGFFIETDAVWSQE